MTGGCLISSYVVSYLTCWTLSLDEIKKRISIFSGEKITREHQFFRVEKMSGVEHLHNIFTYVPFGKKNDTIYDAIYDGIVVYFSWIVVFWQ